MSKPYYSEYVKHALRFYSRNCSSRPAFKSDADKYNWLSCDSVLSRYPSYMREILLSVYSGYDTLPDEVYKASKEHNIEQNLIWDSMKELERKIAKRRELI